MACPFRVFIGITALFFTVSLITLHSLSPQKVDNFRITLWKWLCLWITWIPMSTSMKNVIILKTSPDQSLFSSENIEDKLSLCDYCIYQLRNDILNNQNIPKNVHNSNNESDTYTESVNNVKNTQDSPSLPKPLISQCECSPFLLFGPRQRVPFSSRPRWFQVLYITLAIFLVVAHFEFIFGAILTKQAIAIITQRTWEENICLWRGKCNIYSENNRFVSLDSITLSSISITPTSDTYPSANSIDSITNNVILDYSLSESSTMGNPSYINPSLPNSYRDTEDWLF